MLHEAANEKLPVKPPGQRLAWVDNARGIGILLVVFGHVWRGLDKAGIAIPPQEFLAVDRWIYAFHMPLFFVLSGLFMERSAGKGIGSFLADKAGTLMWPYFLWTLAQWTCARLSGSAANTPATAADLLQCPWRPYAQFWFLYVLFLTSIIAWAVYRFRLGSWGLLIAAVAWRICPVQMEFWPLLYQVRAYIPYFALGAVASGLLCSQLPRAGGWLLAAAAVTLTIGLTKAVAVGWDHPANFAWLHLRIGEIRPWLPACAGIGAVVAAAALLERSGWATLAFIGSMSLAIYAAHVILAAAARTILLKVLHDHGLWTHIEAGMAFGVIGSMVLYAAAQRFHFPWLFALRRRSSRPDHRIARPDAPR